MLRVMCTVCITKQETSVESPSQDGDVSDELQKDSEDATELVPATQPSRTQGQLEEPLVDFGQDSDPPDQLTSTSGATAQNFLASGGSAAEEGDDLGDLSWVSTDDLEEVPVQTKNNVDGVATKSEKMHARLAKIVNENRNRLPSYTVIKDLLICEFGEDTFMANKVKLYFLRGSSSAP